MHDVLKQQAAQLARLAMMIRIGLDSAESAIPGINDLLAELATLGVTEFQIEGPAVYCRPAGPSSAYDDSFVVYQAAIIQPGGIGCILWDAADYHEHTTPPRGAPVDLAASLSAMTDARRSCGHCSLPMQGGCSSDSWAMCACSARSSRPNLP